MRLIDATTMWQCETCYWHGNTGCSSFIWCENGESYRPSMDKLKQVDAVEVVRCKDCEYQQECKNAQYLGLDGYCSRGERKGGDE